jgi:hypothetical protein
MYQVNASGPLDQPRLAQPIRGERGHQRGVLAVVVFLPRLRGADPVALRWCGAQP